MKLIDVVYKFRDGRSEYGKGAIIPSHNYGDSFYSWFDKEFGLKPIEAK